MKNLYHKSKGKVHPSPSSSLPPHSPNRDALSMLKLLPAAILALVSILSLEDREVLAYLITRSIKTTNPNPFSMIEEKRKCKKIGNNNSHNNSQKSPDFDCGCFDCYTSYWIRWDSSSNRELIHQAIEAFEEHLTNGELSKKNSRGKKREKMSRRVLDKSGDKSEKEKKQLPEKETESSSEMFIQEPENDVFLLETLDNGETNGVQEKKEYYEEDEVEDLAGNNPETVGALQNPSCNHKGLARKVLPDVLGLFNSRLWNLWSPNV